MHKFDSSTVNIKGALVHTPPEIKTAADWCEYYGVKVTRGHAILFKAVDEDYSTENARPVSVAYIPGSRPKAPDWDGGVAECGGGLHFSPSPSAACFFNKDPKHYVACPVKLDEIVVHPNGRYPAKIKAPRVAGAIYEVDIDGERLDVAK